MSVGGIFTPKPLPPEPKAEPATRTGTEILRHRLKAGKARNLGLIVRDLWEDHQVKVPLDALQSFQDKGAPLPVDTLRALTRMIFKSFAEYRFEDDSIVSSNPPATPACGPNYPPAPYVPPVKVDYVAGAPPPLLSPGSQPERKYIPQCERPASWPPKWT